MGGPGSGRRKELDKISDAATTQVAASAPAAPPAPPITVTTASGATLRVLTDEEKTFYERQRDTYLEEFGFTSLSDKADLDALLFQEMMSHRWTVQLATGTDYAGQPLHVTLANQYRVNQNDAARSISQIKTTMGMTRASRDADKGSVSEYLTGLLRSAKQFGIHRNEQVILVLTLFNELKMIVGTYDRSNATERNKVGIEAPEDIVEWIRTIAIPKYEELDKKWVDSTQRYWEGL